MCKAKIQSVTGKLSNVKLKELDGDEQESFLQS